MRMKTGRRGIALIKSYEKLRLKAYKPIKTDPWTIGWGRAHGVKKGDTCTEAEADQMLLEDLKTAERFVNRIKGLTQVMFDALVCFTFNAGGAWTNGSGLLDRLKAKQYDLVPSEMTRWVYSGGKTRKGLARRRVEASALFLA